MFEEDEMFEDQTFENEYREWLADDMRQRSADLYEDMKEDIYG